MIFVHAANQRAGAWYVKPSDEKAHAYFKCALPPSVIPALLRRD